MTEIKKDGVFAEFLLWGIRMFSRAHLTGRELGSQFKGCSTSRRTGMLKYRVPVEKKMKYHCCVLEVRRSLMFSRQTKRSCFFQECANDRIRRRKNQNVAPKILSTNQCCCCLLKITFSAAVSSKIISEQPHTIPSSSVPSGAVSDCLPPFPLPSPSLSDSCRKTSSLTAVSTPSPQNPVSTSLHSLGVDM